MMGVRWLWPPVRAVRNPVCSVFTVAHGEKEGEGGERGREEEETEERKGQGERKEEGGGGKKKKRREEERKKERRREGAGRD